MFSATLARLASKYSERTTTGYRFLQLWPDPQLVYTCAYYAFPGATLEQAQVAKLDYVCRKVQLQPGERAWKRAAAGAALALHMAKTME